MKKLSARKERKLRVGVTLFIRDATQSLWENGIFQNCYFLLMLLAKSPIVDKCFIVNGGPGSPDDSVKLLAQAPAPVIDLATAMNELDVVIELSAQLNVNWGHNFVQRGGRIIGMHVANDFFIDSERIAYGLPSALLMAPVPYHEIWTLSSFQKSNSGYYKSGFKAPVKVMPHLWSSAILDQREEEGSANGFLPYVQRDARWRIGIMEPNICSVKTCHLPLLLCDVAHRLKGNSIEYVRVFNALLLKEQPGFVAFARSLDLVKAGLATFEGRFPLPQILLHQCNAIVSHQWENAQNYLYYEALYGGYPLIHNSDALGDCGYRYRTYDPEDGALALLEAMRRHDIELDIYKQRAHTFLDSLDPLNKSNIETFSSAISAVYHQSAAS